MEAVYTSARPWWLEGPIRLRAWILFSLSAAAVAAAAGDRLPVIVAPVDKYTTTERVHRPDERIRVN